MRIIVSAMALALAAPATSGCAAATTGPRPAASATALPSNPQALKKLLEAAYEKNRQALLARDLTAIQALRTADYHVVTPDGVTHGPEAMLGFSRNLVDNVQQWLALSFTFDTATRNGNEVSADVRQHSIRMQMRDGTVRRIENWVTQRETWVMTPDGLKLKRVDNIRDQKVLIDGKPRQ